MPRPGENGTARSGLDLRLQVRALVMAVQPRISQEETVSALVTMAGVTTAAPIAARRALQRVEVLHRRQPTERTMRAVEALHLALARVASSRPSPAGPHAPAVLGPADSATL